MAGTSSTLTWNLVANSAAYVSGMQRAAGSTDKFKRALGDAEKQQRNLSRTILSAAVGLAVVRFGQQSVKAYAEAEKAQARLAEAYRKFPKLADASIESLRELNSELQKKTRFDDDATAAAQASLAMYDLTGQQIRELTPLVQDLAAATGGDVTDAADSLGKAFLGNARALKAVGIDFKATGDRAKDFDTIMGALRTKVGGFAESEGKTAAGQLAIMNNAVGDLQESVGQALIPALTQMVDIITPAVQGFTNLSPSTRTAAITIAAVGTAAVVAAPPILRLNAALAATGGRSLLGMVGKAGPYALAAVAITGLAVAAKDSLDDLKAYDKVLEDLGPKAPAVAQVAAMQDRIQQLKDTLNDPGVLRMIRTGWEYVLGIPNEADLTGDQLAAASQKYAQFQAAVSAVAWELKIPLSEAQARVAESGINLAGTSADVVARFREYERTAGALAGVTKANGDAWHDAEGNLKTFKQALDDVNGSARSLTGSKIALIEKTKDLAKGLREGSMGFTLSTKAGRENLSNLIEVTSGIEAMGAAMDANGAPREKVIAAMQREKDALVDNLDKMGLSHKAAQKLVDKYLKIPPAADAAATKVDELTTAVGKVPTTKTITFKVTAQMTAAGAKALSIDKKDKSGPNGTTGWDPLHHASGGLIRGPGTGTSDSIPAMLSNGEYVMRASSVARHGRGFFDSLNFAGGGLVDTGFKHRRKKHSGKSTPKRSGGKASTSSGGGRDMSLRDSLRDGAGLLGAFDLDGYSAAVDRAVQASDALKSAQLGVFEARRRANAAGTPAERAEAEAEVARALEEQAAATKEVAAANKAKASSAVTGKNILGGFRARAAKLDRFRRDLKTLKSWGLSGVIIRQLVDAGIDDGGDMAAALVKDRSVIAELNSTQRAIGADAAALNARYGDKGTSSAGGGGSSGSAGTTGSNGSVSISFDNADKPVVLKVDSEQVWKGLLRLKKSKGGASLGLS